LRQGILNSSIATMNDVVMYGDSAIFDQLKKDLERKIVLTPDELFVLKAMRKMTNAVVPKFQVSKKWMQENAPFIKSVAPEDRVLEERVVNVEVMPYLKHEEKTSARTVILYQKFDDDLTITRKVQDLRCEQVALLRLEPASTKLRRELRLGILNSTITTMKDVADMRGDSLDVFHQLKTDLGKRCLWGSYKAEDIKDLFVQDAMRMITKTEGA
jgi:hypothetical protein